MKKALSLFLALLMCLSLCACGGKADEAPITKEDLLNTAEPYDIENVTDIMNNQAKASTYVGKTLITNAYVSEITTEYCILTRATSGHDGKSYANQQSPVVIYAYLDIETLTELKVNDSIEIVGTVDSISNDKITHLMGDYERIVFVMKTAFLIDPT